MSEHTPLEDFLIIENKNQQDLIDNLLEKCRTACSMGEDYIRVREENIKLNSEINCLLNTIERLLEDIKRISRYSTLLPPEILQVPNETDTFNLARMPKIDFNSYTEGNFNPATAIQPYIDVLYKVHAFVLENPALIQESLHLLINSPKKLGFSYYVSEKAFLTGPINVEEEIIKQFINFIKHTYANGGLKVKEEK